MVTFMPTLKITSQRIQEKHFDSYGFLLHISYSDNLHTFYQ